MLTLLKYHSFVPIYFTGVGGNRSKNKNVLLESWVLYTIMKDWTAIKVQIGQLLTTKSSSTSKI